TGTGQRQAHLTGTTSNDFGMLAVNAISGSVTWTVTNDGDVLSGAAALTNGDPTEVQVNSNNCTGLAGGASCTIVVSFSPTKAGTRSGTLTLAASPGGMVTFTASATG